jgi:F-type H+-transporting ATPase subunit b
MPQLNPEFFVTQLFWLVVTFSFLLVFLWRISLPRISNVLEKRDRKISEDLTTAKELQNEAETIQDTIESQIKQARTDASEMIKSASLTFQDKTQIELTKFDKELDAKIEQSSAAIEKSKNESVLQIQNQINEITKLTLSKVAAFDVSDDEIKSAVKSTERSIN